jgi:tetratricopeptide (TPR) repeat protein
MLDICNDIFEFEKANKIPSRLPRLLNLILLQLPKLYWNLLNNIPSQTILPNYLPDVYINTIKKLLKKSKKAVDILNIKLNKAHHEQRIKLEFEFLSKIHPIMEAFSKCARYNPNYITCEVGRVIFSILCAENFSDKHNVISRTLLEALERKIHFNNIPAKLSWYLFYIVGHGYLTLSDFSTAIKYFDKVISYEPEYWEAYFARGIAYTQKAWDIGRGGADNGMYAEALSNFQHLIDNENHVPPHILEKTYQAYGYARHAWYGGNPEASLSKCNFIRKQLGLTPVKKLFFKNSLQMEAWFLTLLKPYHRFVGFVFEETSAHNNKDELTKENDHLVIPRNLAVCHWLERLSFFSPQRQQLQCPSLPYSSGQVSPPFLLGLSLSR